MSWVPGIRSTAAQSSADKTTAVVGPSKSATEEMVCWDCKLYQLELKFVYPQST